MPTLDELAIKYGTDKSSLAHNYTAFYEKHLPKNPKKILEIGVNEGKSLAVWLDYFPDAEVWGLDLYSENSVEDVQNYLFSVRDKDDVLRRTFFQKGSQVDWFILEQLRKESFDIIIDDASHLSRMQMMTFFGLMHKDCHYFIEDTHCCYEEFYRDGLPEECAANELFGSLWDSPTKLNVIPHANIILIKSA